MKLSWRDAAATIVILIGAVVVYAKLQSYSWWLIGSWKGALGVITILGLLIAALYAIDWVGKQTTATLYEVFLWGMAAVTALVSLLVVTTKAEFVWTAVLIGAAWLTELSVHAWETTHHRNRSHMVGVH